jgi:MFS family permease
MVSLPRHYHRNFVAFLGEWISLGLAFNLASQTTTLPDFVGRLTDSKVVVGLFSTIRNSAFLFPQLIFANFLTNKRRKKPYFILAAVIGRPLYLLYAVALWLGLDRNPTLALLLFFAMQLLLQGSGALLFVAWSDLFAKAIPDERRGRLIGIAQVISGALVIGAAAHIATLLGKNGPPFPYNYAILFALAGGCLLFGLFSFSFVVEPDRPVEEERSSWRDYLPHLLNTLRHDSAFRCLIIVELLTGFNQLARSFYILFATRELGLPPKTVGVFTGVQAVGGFIASLGLGMTADRVGSHRVVQIATALSATVPLLCLGLLLSGVRDSVVITAICAWAFLVIGVIVMGSPMLGFYNYVLELAPAGQRPTYIGLYNTIKGAQVVLPLVGGWLLQTTSYSLLFALTAAILVVAHVLSWGLPSARCSTAL